MANPYFPGQTLDDLMRAVILEIRSHGGRTDSRHGPATEITGVLLELKNPRARLSRTETRGKPFSCVGELCWYLAKRNDLGFIAYYLPEYREAADGDSIFGGYGPRLFAWNEINQVDQVTSLLRKRPDSRQAVIQLFEANDITEEHKDVPCTCTLQFMVRGGRLQMMTNMRSNDAYLGLPHDIFCFTMLQELIARALGVELGTYKHAVGSLHLYDKQTNLAQQFLAEGWQPTDTPMPPMPVGDPWLAVETLLEAESGIRTGGAFEGAGVDALDPYWADLVRLLRVFRHVKDSDSDAIPAILAAMSSPVYDPFINRRLREIGSLARGTNNAN